ncbi:MAG: hypothetical protein ACK5TA_03785, partial [bacterium]
VPSSASIDSWTVSLYVTGPDGLIIRHPGVRTVVRRGKPDPVGDVPVFRECPKGGFELSYGRSC